jgi:hypothetical protein
MRIRDGYFSQKDKWKMENRNAKRSVGKLVMINSFSFPDRIKNLAYHLTIFLHFAP